MKEMNKSRSIYINVVIKLNQYARLMMDRILDTFGILLHTYVWQEQH